MLEKDTTEFSPRGKKGFNPYCRVCKREYDKRFYQKTISTRRKNKKVNSKLIRSRNTKFIWDYLSCHPCIDCGEKDPIVLEFDHKENKKYNISEMTNLSIECIESEINKCEVRCANCHRRKTAIQFQWYRSITG